MRRRASAGIGYALGLATLLAAAGATQSEPDWNAFVECDSEGQKILKRRRDCVGASTVVRSFDARSEAAGTGGRRDWIAREGDHGILLAATLSCRSQQTLDAILSSQPVNRRHLARAAAEAGSCAVLAARTPLVITGATSGLLRARNVELGPIWLVAPEEVPGLEKTPIRSGMRAGAEGSAPRVGLTAEEGAAVKEQLATRPTVSGFGGRASIGGASHVPGVRSHEAAAALGGARGGVVVKRTGIRATCKCANGQVITTLRSGLDACDEACGVQSSQGSDTPEADTCRFHGFATDCVTSGTLKAHEALGNPIVDGDR